MELQPVDEVRAALIHRALGNEDRKRIYDALASGPTRQRKLARTLGIKETTLLYHLRFLREAGLVEFEAKEDAKFVRRVSDVLVCVEPFRGRMPEPMRETIRRGFLERRHAYPAKESSESGSQRNAFR